MPSSQSSAGRRSATLVLVGVCGVAATLAAVTSFPIPPGAALAATLAGCVVLAAATLPAAIRALAGPRYDRPLIVCGVVLIGVSGALLPQATVDITWGKGPRNGDTARPFLASAFRQTKTAYELHATPGNPAGRDNWFYELHYDLTTLPNCGPQRVYFSYTRQEGDQLDEAGAPMSLRSPLRFTIRCVDPPGTGPLLELSVPPSAQADDWQRASFEVPAGTRRLLIAVDPLAPEGGTAPARIWLAFQPPQPIVGKLKVTAPIERGARGLTATWLYAIVVHGFVMLRERLKRNARDSAADTPSAARPAHTAGVLALTVAAVTLLLYFAPVTSVHAMSDDFAFFQFSHENPRALYASMTGCGRYVSATMLHFAFSLVRCLAEFSYLRAAGALALAASAALLARHLLRYGWTPAHALAIALLAATTPSAALAVGWTQEFTKPFALLLCSGAFAIIASTLEDAAHGGGRDWLRMLASAAILSCAFLIHQSNGMYFIVLIAISAWAQLEKDALWRVLIRTRWAAGALAIAMFVALAAVKLNPAPVERAALMTSPLAKLAWFVTVPLVNVSTFAILPTLPAATAVVGTLVALGLLVLLAQGRLRAVTGLTLLLVLLPVTYAPTLAVAENWPSFRSLFCVYALAIFICAVALRAIVAGERHVFTLLLLLAAVASLAVFAQQTRVRLTQPAAIETRVFREALRRVDTAQAQRLHLIGPHWTQSVSNRVWYDEFGFPTSSHFWSAEHMAYAMSRELPAAQRDALMSLDFTWGPPLEHAPPGVVQIDMRELAHWRPANN